MPASVTSTTPRLAVRAHSSSDGGARRARCPRSRTPPGRGSRSRGRWPAAAAGGCPRRRPRRRRRSSAASRGGASSTRPIGRRREHEHAGRRSSRHGSDHRSRTALARVHDTVTSAPALRAHRRALAHRGRATSCRAARGAAPGCGPRDHDPVLAWVGDRRRHAARRVPAAVGPRQAARVPVRRDLLRQGRLVAVPPRLRRRTTSTRPTSKILAGHTCTASGPSAPDMVVHPEVGKWLIGAGRERLRDGPVRLAGRLGRRRLADGAGDDPARAPGHPLHPARPGRRAADVLRRPAARALPAGAARHLPGVLRAVRGQLHGRRPRLGPRPAGARWCRRARGWRPASWGPVRCCGGRGGWRPGVFWGLAIGTKWSALFPLAAFGLLMWVWDAGARRSFGVRGRVLKSAVVDALPGVRLRRAAAAR